MSRREVALMTDMVRAMELTGLRTKRAVVDAALRALIQRRRRQLLRKSFGKYPWEGDLDQMRGRVRARFSMIVADSSG
jgi:Arc/MetJ family transcription regulator